MTSMNYEQVLTYLYENLPMFQRVGGSAYKKDLTNTYRLCDYLGNPEKKFKSVHIAGTNGKGSSSHFIASILQEAGYRVGLYTSPHLKSFTERIRLNGKEVEKEFVTSFVNEHQPFIESLRPSFFEITVGMAFQYFAAKEVDIAVIEVGMGGRLDSTNVIVPEVGLITNISFDHQQWLGNTLPEIAMEKAGIIKKDIPVVIGEKQEELIDLFSQKAMDTGAPAYYAFEEVSVDVEGDEWVIHRNESPSLRFSSQGLPAYQQRNLPGVITVVKQLNDRGYSISDENIIAGIRHMKQNTSLKGRWDVLDMHPLVVCDVGHNIAGISFVLQQLESITYNQLHMVIGMVSDKDIRPVLSLLPKNAMYYFCEAKIPRAMPAEGLAGEASTCGLRGEVIPDVNDAIKRARARAAAEDVIFIGGSNFVVAEINELE